jgi:hypothetical protein
MENYLVIGKADNSLYLKQFQESPEPLFSEYVKQINSQRALNPNFPKLKDSLPFISKTKYTSAEITNIVLSDSFYYQGITEIAKKTYWEFCDIASSPVNNRFAYIEVSESNLALISSELPALYQTNNSTNKVESVYPTSANLFQPNPEKINRYNSLVTGDLTHPLLPGFYFSGRIYILYSSLYYEYFDNRGIYGVKNQTYISNLRPLYLDFPTGLPARDNIYTDECLEQLRGFPPTIYADDQKGVFTSYVYKIPVGNYSSRDLKPETLFYIYKREDNTIFASSSAPIKEYLLLDTNPSIDISTLNSTHKLSITQQSPSLTLELLIQN